MRARRWSSTSSRPHALAGLRTALARRRARERHALVREQATIARQTLRWTQYALVTTAAAVVVTLVLGVPALLVSLHDIERAVEAVQPPNVRVEWREQFEAHNGALVGPMDLGYFWSPTVQGEEPPEAGDDCRHPPPGVGDVDAVVTRVFVSVQARPNQTVRVEGIRLAGKHLSSPTGYGTRLVVCRHGFSFLLRPVRTWLLDLDGDDPVARFDADRSGSYFIEIQPNTTEVINLVAYTFEHTVAWHASLRLSAGGRTWDYPIGTPDDPVVTVAPDPERPLLVWLESGRTWHEEPWSKEALRRLIRYD